MPPPSISLWAEFWRHDFFAVCLPTCSWGVRCRLTLEPLCSLSFSVWNFQAFLFTPGICAVDLDLCSFFWLVVVHRKSLCRLTKVKMHFLDLRVDWSGKNALGQLLREIPLLGVGAPAYRVSRAGPLLFSWLGMECATPTVHTNSTRGPLCTLTVC